MARDIPQATRDALRGRSEGRCELNAAHRGEQAQHRHPRGIGGSTDPEIHSLANLIHLCADCHGWVERNRAISYELGWLVRSWGPKPMQVPVLLSIGHLGGGWYWLDTDGGREPAAIGWRAPFVEGALDPKVTCPGDAAFRDWLAIRPETRATVLDTTP